MAKAVVSVKLTQNYTSVRLRVSTSSDLSNPVYSDVFATVNTIAKVTIDGLLPDTQYYYGVLIHGTLQTQGRGKFRTFPASASSFTCAFASCAPIGNNNTVFDTIRNSNPLFFIHMGDMHYANITTNNISLFRDAYDTVFDQSRQAALYANIPTMYMWDDHDFSANDGDGTSPSKPAAQAAYKERVPHYPLNTSDGGTYQSWVVGRVRFILADLMSYKTPMDAADTIAKSQFGETQLQWFFNELTKPEPLKIWVNTKPWIGESDGAPSDKWWGFTAERNRIGNFIKENNLEGHVAIISGDMHGIAIDDGSNSDYATGGGGAIPVFQAAPLGSNGSVKGGGWSHGSFTNGTNGNQWGQMNIIDDGTSADIVMEWNGKRDNTTLVSWSMNVPSAPYVKPTNPDEQPEQPEQPSGDIPTDGLALHYDVATSSLTMSGTDVTGIADLSGNSRNGVSGTRPPVLDTTTYSRAVLDFQPDATGSGVGENIEVPMTPAFVNNNEYTMMYVGVMDEFGAGLSQKILDFAVNASDASGILNFSVQGSTQSLQVSRTENASPKFSLPDNYTANSMAIFSTVSTTESVLYLNGTEMSRVPVTMAGDLGNITHLRIGGRYGTGSPNHFDGKIGEVIVYNRALSASELTQVHDYLKAKWSIT